MTKEEIDNYFKLKELKYIKLDENIWHLRYRNWITDYERNFEITVTLLTDWLCLRVPLEVAIKEACWPYLTEYLLGLNYRVFCSKIALQGQQIYFMVDLPVRCNITDLDEAMIALNTYVRAYYLNIETVATSPQLALLVHTAFRSSMTGESIEDLGTLPDLIFND